MVSHRHSRRSLHVASSEAEYVILRASLLQTELGGGYRPSLVAALSSQADSMRV